MRLESPEAAPIAPPCNVSGTADAWRVSIAWPRCTWLTNAAKTATPRRPGPSGAATPGRCARECYQGGWIAGANTARANLRSSGTSPCASPRAPDDHCALRQRATMKLASKAASRSTIASPLSSRASTLAGLRRTILRDSSHGERNAISPYSTKWTARRFPSSTSSPSSTYRSAEHQRDQHHRPKSRRRRSTTAQQPSRSQGQRTTRRRQQRT